MLIACLGWFKDGRHLLSAGYDARLIVWDVQEAKVKRLLEFKSALYRAYICPNNEYVFFKGFSNSETVISYWLYRRMKYRFWLI